MLKQLRLKRAQNRLLNALQEGNNERLRKALKAGANPCQTVNTPDGMLPPLLMALDRNLPDAVQLLLAAGATAAECDEPLLCRAINKLEQPLAMLTQLLQAGIGQQRDSALFACLSQHNEAQAQLLITRLLEYGADIHARNERGQNLLECVLVRDWMTLSTTLINAGAQLPPNLDLLDCSETLKTLARRTAEDIEIRARLLQR